MAETVNPASTAAKTAAKTAKRTMAREHSGLPIPRRRDYGAPIDQSRASDVKVSSGNPRAVWIGPSESDELALARHILASRIETTVLDLETLLDPKGLPNGDGDESRLSVADQLGDREPLVACLAADGPRRPVHETALRLARRWPLCRFVAIASSLCEGRRRSGPPTPGVEEIPWHDLPGRLEWWLEDAENRRPGWLGQPATLRREDRLLEGLRTGPTAAAGIVPERSVAVAAAREESLEGLTSLLASFGSPVMTAAVGRPAMDVSADVLLWECPESVAAELPWLGILAAHRPSTDIVLLESFPRGDRACEAIRAGASWVLGRPTPADVLLGTLCWLARNGRGSGLGRAVATG